MRLTKKEMERLLNEETTAPVWKRVLAYLIDILVIEFLILSPLQDIILNLLGNDINSLSELIAAAQGIDAVPGTLIVIASIMAVLGFAYFVLLEKLVGQTLGKAALRIKVTSEQHRPISWGQALGRNITKGLLITSLSLLFVIDVIYLLFKKDKRLSDKLFKTGVENE